MSPYNSCPQNPDEHSMLMYMDDMDASDRAALLQLLDEPGGWHLSDFETGPCNRVTKLLLGNSQVREEGDGWGYQKLNGALIAKLDMLEFLDVCCFQSLPLTALAQLPHLKYLHICLINGVSLTESMREETALPHAVLSKLVQLEISHGFWDVSSMRVWMTWVVTCLPILQTLKFSHLVPLSHPSDRWIPGSWGERDDTTYISDEDKRSYLVNAALEVLVMAGQNSTGHEASFRHSLTTVEWNKCGMKNAGLQCLLFKVLPNYPNLSTISVCQNNISSLQFLLPSAGEPHSCLLSTSLFKLELENNPIMSTYQKSETESRAINRLLDVLCPFLGSFGYIWTSLVLDAATEGRLSINRSGGRILFRQNQNEVESVIYRANVSKSVPDGLWPFILERSYRMEYIYCSTWNRQYARVVYYLLRNFYFAHSKTQMEDKEKTKSYERVGRKLVKEGGSGGRKKSRKRRKQFH